MSIRYDTPRQYFLGVLNEEKFTKATEITARSNLPIQIVDEGNVFASDWIVPQGHRGIFITASPKQFSECRDFVNQT